jgi:hypothetical protein
VNLYVAAIICIVPLAGLAVAVIALRKAQDARAAVRRLGFESLMDFRAAQVARRTHLGEEVFQRVLAKMKDEGLDPGPQEHPLEREELCFRAAAHYTGADARLALPPSKRFRLWHPIAGMTIFVVDVVSEQGDFSTWKTEEYMNLLLGCFLGTLAAVFLVERAFAERGFFGALWRAALAAFLVLIPTWIPGVLFAGVPGAFGAVRGVRALARKRSWLRQQDASTWANDSYSSLHVVHSWELQPP